MRPSIWRPTAAAAGLPRLRPHPAPRRLNFFRSLSFHIIHLTRVRLRRLHTYAKLDGLKMIRSSPFLFSHRLRAGGAPCIVSFRAGKHGAAALCLLASLALCCAVPAAAQTPPVPTTVSPQSTEAAPHKPDDKKPDEKKDGDKKQADKKTGDETIINNPFMPGGVVKASEMISRTEVMAMLEARDAEMKKHITSAQAQQSMSAEDLSKLVASTGAVSSLPAPPKIDNFMGCVNGVPLYRQMDGTLDLGTKDSENLKKEKCG